MDQKNDQDGHNSQMTQQEQQIQQEREYFSTQPLPNTKFDIPVQKKSNIPFDYSQCTFECRFKKKKMIGYKTKHVYMKENLLILCNEPYQKYPDKIITLMPYMKVVWLLEKKTPQQMKTSQGAPRIVGFRIKIGKEELEYKAEEVVIQRLKETFSQIIFQVRFQDQYEVLCQIGKGNYARVFSVRSRQTGQKYACKCFEKKKLINMDKGIASLYNELKVMRAVNDHPNVIKLVEVFEGENTFYFVMEISEGPSLYEEIKRHADSQFSDESVYYIMKGLVQGLHYCAKKGIMHRDLKPENLLFKEKNSHKNLKIVDFGLAAFKNDDPYIFPKCGTPGFVAPEIANLVDKSQPYDPICDMFSVGVVFNILLTGDAVFPGKKFNEVLKKNKDCKINLNTPAYEFLSPEAKDLLGQMLQKEPKYRISAEKALQHPYFTNKQQVRRSSMDQTQMQQQMLLQQQQQQQQQQQKLMHQQMIEEIPNTRPKNQTLFTKPLRLPYVNKQEGSINITDQYVPGNGSFVTQDPLFKHKEMQLQTNIKNQGTDSMTNSPFNSPYQVPGLMSPAFTFSPQQVGQTGDLPPLELGSDGKSKFSQKMHKDSIQEDQDEDELSPRQQQNKNSQFNIKQSPNQDQKKYGINGGQQYYQK